MKLSKLFEKAVEHLYDPGTGEGERQFSCNAIKVAAQVARCPERADDAIEFAEELGLDLTRGAAHPFGEFEYRGYPTPSSQQARALWLTWCAMIAKEEGR